MTRFYCVSPNLSVRSVRDMQMSICRHITSSSLQSKQRRKSRCLALPASLDIALSRRTNKALLRSICEDAFLQQQTAFEQRQTLFLEQQAQARQRLALQGDSLGQENIRLRQLLRDRTAQLLARHGALTITGVLKYLEHEHSFVYFFDEHPSCQEVWTDILERRHQLTAELLRATDDSSRQSTSIGSLAQDITFVSQHVSSDAIATAFQEAAMGRQLEIIEGPLLLKYCKMMVCVCEYYEIPYKLRHLCNT